MVTRFAQARIVSKPHVAAVSLRRVIQPLRASRIDPREKAMRHKQFCDHIPGPGEVSFTVELTEDDARDQSVQLSLSRYDRDGHPALVKLLPPNLHPHGVLTLETSIAEGADISSRWRSATPRLRMISLRCRFRSSHDDHAGLTGYRVVLSGLHRQKSPGCCRTLNWGLQIAARIGKSFSIAHHNRRGGSH